MCSLAAPSALDFTLPACLLLFPVALLSLDLVLAPLLGLPLPPPPAERLAEVQLAGIAGAIAARRLQHTTCSANRTFATLGHLVNSKFCIMRASSSSLITSCLVRGKSQRGANDDPAGSQPLRKPGDQHAIECTYICIKQPVLPPLKVPIRAEQ